MIASYNSYALITCFSTEERWQIVRSFHLSMFYIMSTFFLGNLHDATLNETGCLYLNIYISIKHTSDPYLASSFHRNFRIKFRYSLYYIQSQAMMNSMYY